ncbi:MAG: sigma-70 family RNA polymerase sigma factor [Ardenticatenaceae bacterium]|nr:sigma-70 family RNA polymerase sigma factor [Ardenticatenaceae bacterium]
MVATDNEHELVSRAQVGDAEAFGDLYELYLDTIYRYIYYRVQNHQDAEDLTEIVFLKAWQNMPDYVIGKTPFVAWVYRIAHNSVIDHYRTRKETIPLSEHPPINDEKMNLEEHILSQEEKHTLSKAIMRLSPLHQHVLVLRFISGLKPSEVADVLDRNVGAIRVLQHRALKALHTLLTAEEITNV